MTFEELWEQVERQQSDRGREGVSTNKGLRKAMQLAYDEGKAAGREAEANLRPIVNPLEDIFGRWFKSERKDNE